MAAANGKLVSPLSQRTLEKPASSTPHSRNRATYRRPMTACTSAKGRLHLDHGPGVPRQLRVTGDQGDALTEGLGQQQAVEGILVQGRQGCRYSPRAGW